MVIIKNLQSRIPIPRKRIKKTVLKTLACAGVKKTGNITLCFLNDRRIKKLNRRFLGKDTPTDVIAFGPSKGERGSGYSDIAVSTDSAARNAKLYGTTPLYETCLYVVHGVLHLAGYRDNTRAQRKIMQNKQEKILRLTYRDYAHP